MTTAGTLVRAARQRHGLSIQELARRAGVDAHTVELVEQGPEDPGMTLLEQLLGALGERVAQRPDGTVVTRPVSRRTRRP